MRRHLRLKSTPRLLVLLLLCAAAERANAQDLDLPELTDLLGTIASPELTLPVDTTTGPEEAAVARKFRFFASVGVTDTDTALAPSLTLGASAARTQLDVRYANLDLDDDSLSLDQFRLRLRHQLVINKSVDHLQFNLTATAQHVDLEDSSETSSISLDGSIGEKDVAALVLNVGYAEKQPDAGKAVNDWTVGVGIIFNVSTELIFGIDYAFENDLTKSDAYSFTVTHVLARPNLPASRVIFGVAKEGTLSASYVVGF